MNVCHYRSPRIDKSGLSAFLESSDGEDGSPDPLEFKNLKFQQSCYESDELLAETPVFSAKQE